MFHNHLFIIILTIISISKEDSLSDCFNLTNPSNSNCRTIEFNSEESDYQNLLCCHRTIKYKNKKADDRKCVVCQRNKTFIKQWINELKRSDYNIKDVSIKCESFYLNKFYFLIIGFFIILL